MKQSFIDSSGFFAHVAELDDHHDQALEIFSRLARLNIAMVTTDAVMVETHALILHRLKDGEALALNFLEQLHGGSCRIERVTSEDERLAILMLRESRGQRLSLCGALSLRVIGRLGIQSVVSFDQHFTRRYALP